MKSTSFVLRGYQEDIKRRVVDAWEHHRSVLVQMPTGTGKTVVLASLVNEQLRISGEESNRCVWIVAHRRELVGQIRETVGRFMMHERPAHDCAADGVNGGGVVGRDALLQGKTPIHVYSIQWLSKYYGDED